MPGLFNAPLVASDEGLRLGRLCEVLRSRGSPRLSIALTKKESYGSLESKRLLEASHNILKTVEDEGLGATFSTGFKGFGGFGVSPVFGFGDSSKLFGYKHVGRREGNLHLYVV